MLIDARFELGIQRRNLLLSACARVFEPRLLLSDRRELVPKFLLPLRCRRVLVAWFGEVELSLDCVLLGLSLVKSYKRSHPPKAS